MCSTKPPTPEKLQAALSGLPGGGLDKPTATAVWAGAVVAYRALHEASGSSAKRERLVALLDSIGTALRAAVESCGTPAARAVGGSVKRAEVEPLAEAIAAELRQAPR